MSLKIAFLTDLLIQILTPACAHVSVYTTIYYNVVIGSLRTLQFLFLIQ